MTRDLAVHSIQRALLPQIAVLYALNEDDLHLYPGYNGCQNLVFFCIKNAASYLLHISYRDDRTCEQILAEIDFIHYLHAHGVRVSRAVTSRRDRYVEVFIAYNHQFFLVAFENAQGHRLPGKEYRYRDHVSINEYCYSRVYISGRMTEQFELLWRKL
jgi:Ser/Thr protein kinase RdoA (MazF antagonist)